MGIFRQFPYSNFHEMNMDEIIKIMREMQDEWAATRTEWSSYKDYIDNYFRNLNLNDEVLAALRVLIADGSLNNVIDPVIAAETARWLQEHITTTAGETVIDNSLTIEGAAADAKAVGVRLRTTESLTGNEWFNGYYNYSDGSFVNIDGWKMSSSLPCYPGDIITYCGPSSQTNRVVILFLDEIGRQISRLHNLGPDYTPVQVTVPDGVTTFRCLAKTSDLYKTYFIYGTNAASNLLNRLSKDRDALKTEIKKINMAQEVCYIDSLAESEGTGSISDPFKTIVAAFNAGYRNLRAKAGLYDINQIFLENDDFNLSLWSNTDQFTSPDREKITIFTGDILTPIYNEGIITGGYTPRSGSRFERVFIDRTLDPTETGAFSVNYNVTVFLWKPGHKARRYEPVLPENFNNQQGTFTFNNSNLTIVPFDSDNVDDLKIYIAADRARIFYFNGANSVNMSDVSILGAYFESVYCQGCADVKIENCDFICTSHGNGVAVHDSNIILNSCLASGCSQDGFNFHEYGNSILNNCDAFYCGDDGISHHQGCTGFINGGEYSFNNSGGITPAFGAIVDIANSICKGNHRGIQLFGATDYKIRDINISNCLSIDNTDFDIYNDGYRAIFINCIYHSQTAIGTGHTNTFYN